MVSLEKWMILTPLQQLPKNGENWGKLIVAKGFKKLPKVQKIARSGHTGLSIGFNQLFTVAPSMTKEAVLLCLNQQRGALSLSISFSFVHTNAHEPHLTLPKLKILFVSKIGGNWRRSPMWLKKSKFRGLFSPSSFFLSNVFIGSLNLLESTSRTKLWEPFSVPQMIPR